MSGIYAAYKQKMVTAGFNWSSGTFALMLVGSGYTPNFETNTTLANIPGGSQLLESPQAMTGTAASAGYCTADNVQFDSLTTTGGILGIAIMENVSGTYNLVCYITTGEGFGELVSDRPVSINWDTRGIFRP